MEVLEVLANLVEKGRLAIDDGHLGELQGKGTVLIIGQEKAVDFASALRVAETFLARQGRRTTV